jgi:hypothetical protein
MVSLQNNYSELLILNHTQLGEIYGFIFSFILVTSLISINVSSISCTWQIEYQLNNFLLWWECLCLVGNHIRQRHYDGWECGYNLSCNLFKLLGAKRYHEIENGILKKNISKTCRRQFWKLAHGWCTMLYNIFPYSQGSPPSISIFTCINVYIHVDLKFLRRHNMEVYKPFLLPNRLNPWEKLAIFLGNNNNLWPQP